MEPEGQSKVMIMMMNPLLPGCPMKMHADSPRSVPPLVAELPQAVPAASDGEGDDGPPPPSHPLGPMGPGPPWPSYHWGGGRARAAGRHGWEETKKYPSTYRTQQEWRWTQWSPGCPPPIQAIVRRVDRRPRTVPATPCTCCQTLPALHPGAWNASVWDGDPMASCCRYMEAPYRAAKRAKYWLGTKVAMIDRIFTRC